MGFTAICAVVFWLTSLGGLPFSLFLVGVLLTWTVGQIRSVESIRAGCMWGGAIHFGIARLLMLVGQLDDPLIALTLHLIPGAYLGACGAVYRQAVELSRIDAAMPAPPDSESNSDSEGSTEHALD